MIGIDLFSGAGGMSLGARLAGIEALQAVEANSHACATYVHNRRRTAMVYKRVEDVGKSDFKDLRNRCKELILFGGPRARGSPCPAKKEQR